MLSCLQWKKFSDRIWIVKVSQNGKKISFIFSVKKNWGRLDLIASCRFSPVWKHAYCFFFWQTYFKIVRTKSIKGKNKTKQKQKIWSIFETCRYIYIFLNINFFKFFKALASLNHVWELVSILGRKVSMYGIILRLEEVCWSS